MWGGGFVAKCRCWTLKVVSGVSVKLHLDQNSSTVSLLATPPPPPMLVRPCSSTQAGRWCRWTADELSRETNVHVRRSSGVRTTKDDPLLKLRICRGAEPEKLAGVSSNEGLLLTSLRQLFPDTNMLRRGGRCVKVAGVAHLQSQNVDRTLKYTSVTRTG